MNRKAAYGTTGVLLLFLIMLIVVAFFTKKSPTPLVENKDIVTPKHFVDSGFKVPPELPNNDVKGAKHIRVDLVFDPHCPGCGLAEQTLGKILQEYNDQGKIDLYLHPVSFLDQLSTDKYSSRAANAFIAVAENHADKAYPFFAKLMAKDFQPKEGQEYKTVEDVQLVELAKSVGVSDDVTINAIKSHLYSNWAINNAFTVSANKHFYYDGKAYTPLLVLNNDYILDLKTVKDAQEVQRLFVDKIAKFQ